MSVIYAVLRWFMRAMTRTYLIGLFRIAGVENVPRHGPLIICPSHSGNP
jgi:1-acyl-sn-glycerol-3-phosphate acyltransferase